MQAAMWEVVTTAIASLGPAVMAVDNTPAMDPSKASAGQQSSIESESQEDELIEYEGMLVSASAAQRRRSAQLATCKNRQSFPGQTRKPHRMELHLVVLTPMLFEHAGVASQTCQKCCLLLCRGIHTPGLFNSILHSCL